jgi:putative transposase
MSNHVHLVVTDSRGLLPDFLREFHRSAAKAINALQGQRENVWANEGCSVVVLGDDEDVASKIAYVATNPVAAALVSRPDEWPGLLRWRESSESVGRPPVYFAKDGRSPDRLVLETRCAFNAQSKNAGRDWQDRLKTKITTRIAEIRRSMSAAGRQFLGRVRVLAQSIFDTALSPEAAQSYVPKIVAHDRELRERLLGELLDFRRAYRRALTDWRAGMRTVLFPTGTWWMRVHHGARAGDSPDADAATGMRVA